MCSQRAALSSLHPPFEQASDSDYASSIASAKDATNIAFQEELAELLQRRNYDKFIAIWANIVEQTDISTHICVCDACRITQGE